MNTRFQGNRGGNFHSARSSSGLSQASSDGAASVALSSQPTARSSSPTLSSAQAIASSHAAVAAMAVALQRQQEKKSDTSLLVHEGGTNGCVKCLKDNAHDQLLICETCNAEYHTFCLDPPLSEVPEGDFFCEHCEAAQVMNDLEKDGLNGMVEALPPAFTSRFGEILWAQGGNGFGWWPACIYDPRLTVGVARNLARKNLGKKHLVYFFECNDAPFTVLPNSKLTPWTDGLMEMYDLGKVAKATGKNRGRLFDKAFQLARMEFEKPLDLRMNWNHKEQEILNHRQKNERGGGERGSSGSKRSRQKQQKHLQAFGSKRTKLNEATAAPLAAHPEHVLSLQGKQSLSNSKARNHENMDGVVSSASDSEDTWGPDIPPLNPSEAAATTTTDVDVQPPKSEEEKAHHPRHDTDKILQSLKLAPDEVEVLRQHLNHLAGATLPCMGKKKGSGNGGGGVTKRGNLHAALAALPSDTAAASMSPKVADGNHSDSSSSSTDRSRDPLFDKKQNSHTKSDKEKSADTDECLYIKLLAADQSDGYNLTNVGFLVLDFKSKVTFEHVRAKIMEEIDPDRLPPFCHSGDTGQAIGEVTSGAESERRPSSSSFKFYVPNLGPVSRKQETSLNVLDFLLKTTRCPGLGDGSSYNPLRVVLHGAT